MACHQLYECKTECHQDSREEEVVAIRNTLELLIEKLSLYAIL